MSEPVETATPAPLATFNPSRPLDEMQAVHASLLQQQRGLAPDDAAANEALTSTVIAFIQRAAASGVYLQGDHERQEAQTLMDYWATRLIRRNHTFATLDSTLADFDESLAPELPDEPSPYQGLQAFGEQDSDFFFGRERLIEKLYERIQSGERLLTVVGASGSGKSSLVLAGLLPRLRAATQEGGEPVWQLITLVPGSDPLANLAAALSNDPLPLPRLLVVDQFEELFTLCKDEATQRAFAQQLLGLTEAAPPCVVVLTMRLDFVGNVARLPEFYARFQAARSDVGVLDINELRAAIEQPAARVGLKFDDGIVDDLVTTILGEGAGLPLLQFTLLKLWRQRKRNRITGAVYKQVGNPRQALERSAEALFAGLIKEEQDAVKHIFLQMVQPGEGSEFTSSRILREQVFAGGPARDRVERMLERLIAEGLVKQTRAPSPQPSPVGTGEGDGAPLTQIEVAHEALVRNWPRLVDWLDEAREGLRERNRLRDAARLWAASDHDPSLLLRGRALDDAERLTHTGDDVNEFVRASRAAAEQIKMREMILLQERATARRLRVIVPILLVVTLAAIVFGIVQTRNLAARKMAAQSFNIISTQIDTGLLLAEQAHRTAFGELPEVRNSLLFGVQQTSDQLLAFLSGHADRVWSVAYNHNPKQPLLASASDDGKVIVWDVEQRKALFALTGPDPQASLYAVAFSPDDKLLAAGDSDGNVIWWDMSTRHIVATRTEHHNAKVATVPLRRDEDGKKLDTLEVEVTVGANVLCLAFSEDGKKLVTGGVDGQVIVWDVATHTVITTSPTNHIGWVWSVAFSPDGNVVASGSRDRAVHLWDLTAPPGTPAISATVPLSDHQATVTSVVFGQLGGKSILASGDATGRIILWDTTTWRADKQKPARRLFRNAMNNTVWGLDFGQGGRLLATSQSGWMQVWQVNSWQDMTLITLQPITPFLHGHTLATMRATFNQDATQFAVAGADGLVSLWQVNSGSAYMGHKDGVIALYVEANGKTMWTLGHDKTLIQWDVLSHQIVLTRSLVVSAAMTITSAPPDVRLEHAAFSRDGFSVAASYGTTLYVWHVADGTLRYVKSDEHSAAINDLAFNGKGLLATGDANGKIVFWNANDGSSLTTLAVEQGQIYRLVFSPDGTLLASGGCKTPIGGLREKDCGRGEVRLWDVSARQFISPALPGKSGFASSLVFSPDAKRLAVGSEDGPVVWDLVTREPINSFREEGSGEITALAFGPSGDELAVANLSDRNITLWNLNTNLPVGDKFQEHRGRINQLVYVNTSDGLMLFSGADDARAAAWDLNLDHWHGRICRIVNRNLTPVEWQRYIGGIWQKTCDIK